MTMSERIDDLQKRLIASVYAKSLDLWLELRQESRDVTTSLNHLCLEGED